MVTTRPPKTIVKPTALGPVANTDTKLLIYGLFQKGRVLAQDGVDIRVDDSPDPFKELRRLLNITLGWRHSRMSRRLAGEGKFTEAIEAQKKALTYNQADNVIYGLAQRYAQAGDVANALENLREAIAQNPRWKAVAARNTSFDKIKDHPEFKALIERE